MIQIPKINSGMVAEWISLIDPQITVDLNYEEKIARLIESQINFLLETEMTELKAKHWVLSKIKNGEHTTIEFSLIAYSQKLYLTNVLNEKDFSSTQKNRLQKNLVAALAQENYLEAAKLRDMLSGLAA